MPEVLIDPRFAKTAAKLLRRHPDKRDRVHKAITQLAANPRHPALMSKKYDETAGIWQSYIDQGPSAWRVWWRWGDGDQIVVISFGPHP